MPHADYVEIAEAEHEILMERNPIRAQFWAAFDAFMQSRHKNAALRASLASSSKTKNRAPAKLERGIFHDNSITEPEPEAWPTADPGPGPQRWPAASGLRAAAPCWPAEYPKPWPHCSAPPDWLLATSDGDGAGAAGNGVACGCLAWVICAGWLDCAAGAEADAGLSGSASERWRAPRCALG